MTLLLYVMFVIIWVVTCITVLSPLQETVKDQTINYKTYIVITNLRSIIMINTLIILTDHLNRLHQDIQPSDMDVLLLILPVTKIIHISEADLTVIILRLLCLQQIILL